MPPKASTVDMKDAATTKCQLSLPPSSFLFLAREKHAVSIAPIWLFDHSILFRRASNVQQGFSCICDANRKPGLGSQD
jgi:hypothetical protein